MVDLNKLTPKQRAFIEEHERMHREFRARVGLEKLSATQIYDMLLRQERGE